MTVPRFFIQPSAIDSQTAKIVCEDERLCRQVNNVLRLRPGEALDFLDGQGSLYRCRLEHSRKGQLTACIEESLKIEERHPGLVHIGLPLLKSGRFEWALEKLTELGVAKISPIIVSRSVVRTRFADQDEAHNDAGPTKLARWQTILKEASEQCERATIPRLVPPRNFDDFMQDEALSPSHKIICAERRAAPHLSNMLGNSSGACLEKEEVAIAIGAEGGFTDREVDLAISHSFVAVSLGDRILRSETAAIYALAIVASKIAAKE